MYASKMVGKFLLEGLRELMPKYPCIGEVRGLGLCIGVEIVCSQPIMKPAANLAGRLLYKYAFEITSHSFFMFVKCHIFLIDRLKGEKVIVATQGEDRNVISLTPPLCFTLDNARRVIEAFDKVLSKIDQPDESPSATANASVLG